MIKDQLDKKKKDDMEAGTPEWFIRFRTGNIPFNYHYTKHECFVIYLAFLQHGSKNAQNTTIRLLILSIHVRNNSSRMLMQSVSR